MKLKHFIWDFDGTLFDTYPVMVDAAVKTLADYGVQETPRNVLKTMKRFSSKELAEKYQLNYPEFLATFHAEEKRDQRLSPPFKETAEVLQGVQSAGGKNYILTHRPLASTRELLANYQLNQYFVEIVALDSGFPRKPEPDSICYLLNKYQLEPQQTIMIGDRRLDIEAGKNATIQTGLFDPDQLFQEKIADYQFDNLLAVLQL